VFIGAEGFHFAALFGNEEAEAASAGGDDDRHEFRTLTSYS